MTSSRSASLGLALDCRRRALTRGRRACVLAALFVLSVSAAASAQRTAQDIESARQLYNQGIELRDRGDMERALEKFRAAHALGNTPVTGLELCRTHAALRQPVEAREVCLGVARIAPLAQETQRSQDARAEASRIAEAERSKIGALRLKVTGVPPGWEPTVLVDGVMVPVAALGQPRAVNPGVHAVSARVGSGVETKATLETREGETRDIELIVQAPSPAPLVEAGGPVGLAAIDRGQKRGNSLPAVSFAVGGVAAVLGTVAGLAALSGERDLSDKCVSKQCGRELHDDLDSAKTWGNVSTVSFVVAGVAAVVGLVSALTQVSGKSVGMPPRTARAPAIPRVAPVLGLGGVGVDGSF